MPVGILRFRSAFALSYVVSWPVIFQNVLNIPEKLRSNTKTFRVPTTFGTFFENLLGSWVTQVFGSTNRFNYRVCLWTAWISRI